MTEKTLFLFTNGFTGDTGDGASAYTEEEYRAYNHAAFAGEVANAGVLSGVLNELAVSGSTSPLSVATGRAILYGFHYQNLSSAVSLSVTTPSVGDTGGRVVVRVNLTNANTPPAENTGRVRVIMNTDGTAAIPSMIQTAATTWDIPLATFVIDTSGDIWTDSSKTVAGVSDARQFAISPLAGMVRLRHTLLAGTAASITWSGIQNDLSHLLIVGQARGDNASNTVGINIRFNGDTGNNYRIMAYAGATGGGNVTAGYAGPYSSLLAFAAMTAASGTANYADPIRIEIPNYAGSTFYKNAFSTGVGFGDGAAGVMNKFTGYWANTAAINQISIISALGNFIAGTKISLYGWR